MPPSSRRRAPWRTASPSESSGCTSALREFFGVEVLGDGVEQRIQTAFHDLIELVQRQADAVIGDAILLEVIGADLFATVAGADHALALGAQLRHLLLHLNFVE